MTELFVDMGTTDEKKELLTNDINLCKSQLGRYTSDYPYFRDKKNQLAEKFAKLGHEFYNEGNYEKAIYNYKQALENNDQHLPARNQLGVIYYKKENFSEAIEHFEKIREIATPPNSYTVQYVADALLSLALIYCKKSNKPTKLDIIKASAYVGDAAHLIERHTLTESRALLKEINDKVIQLSKSTTQKVPQVKVSQSSMSFFNSNNKKQNVAHKEPTMEKNLELEEGYEDLQISKMSLLKPRR